MIIEGNWYTGKCLRLLQIASHQKQYRSNVVEEKLFCSSLKQKNEAIIDSGVASEYFENRNPTALIAQNAINIHKLTVIWIDIAKLNIILWWNWMFSSSQWNYSVESLSLVQFNLRYEMQIVEICIHFQLEKWILCHIQYTAFDSIEIQAFDIQVCMDTTLCDTVSYL